MEVVGGGDLEGKVWGCPSGGTRPREDRTVLLVTVWFPVDVSQLPLLLKTGPLSSVTSQISNGLAPVVDQRRAINVAEDSWG